MNYIFFGTPRFAEIVLDELLMAGLPPVAIVCNPDRPVGRKKVITSPPTKKLVNDQRLSITVLQPEKLDADFEQKLMNLHPDFFVVAAYAKIIPQNVLDIARLGTLGTHPSLLPKYRGASPIQSAILAGESTTGASIYLMDAKMDHGPILTSASLQIRDDENYIELEENLANLAGKLLAKIIPDFFSGAAKTVEQNHADATFTKKFTTEDGFIVAEDVASAQAGNASRARHIDRLIRALNPEPGVWTIQDNKRIKLLAGRIENDALLLTTIQREGEKPKALI